MVKPPDFFDGEDDQILSCFLSVATEGEALRELDRLLPKITETATQAIRGNWTIGPQFSVERDPENQEEDRAHNALIDSISSVLEHLWKRRRGETKKPVQKLNGFVDAVVRYTSSKAKYKTNPALMLLSGRLKYLLKRSSKLIASGPNADDEVALAAAPRRRPNPKVLLVDLLDDPRSLMRRLYPKEDLDRKDEEDLAVLILETVGVPLRRRDLLDVLAAIKGIERPKCESLDTEQEDVENPLAGQGRDPVLAAVLAEEAYQLTLAITMREIQVSLFHHRVAVLLGFEPFVVHQLRRENLLDIPQFAALIGESVERGEEIWERIALDR